VGKFLLGVAAGSITVYVPKYVEEVSPTKYKGTFGTYFQLFLTFGIFLGPLIALPIPVKPTCVDINKCPLLDDWKKNWNVKTYWHILFSLPIITAVLQLILLTFVFKYDTPTFYKERGMTEELNVIMNKIYSPDVVQRKIDEISVAKEGASLSYKEGLFG